MRTANVYLDSNPFHYISTRLARNRERSEARDEERKVIRKRKLESGKVGH